MYDKNGKPVEKFTQWDQNREIYFDEETPKENLVAHVFNATSKFARVVKIEDSATEHNKKVKIPNEFLQEAKRIGVHIRIKEGSLEKVIAEFSFDVDRQPRPDDYTFVENIEYTDWIALTEEARTFMTIMEESKTACDTAAGNALSSASHADLMAEEASKVDIKMHQEATGATIITTDRKGIVTTAKIDTIISVKDWKNVQMLVRDGAGPELFPPGYTFGVKNMINGKMEEAIVLCHDNIPVANPRLTHTMTLRKKLTRNYDNGGVRYLQFCRSQALFYAEAGLAAGTYNFTVQSQAWCETDNGKTYEFTLTKPVPAGGQIVLHDNSYNKPLLGTHVATYSVIAGTDPIETAVLSEGATGTSLGSTDGKTANMNHMHRVLLGSNNYAQSALEQWMNSDKKGAEVWKPQTKFDRAPTWLGMDGMMTEIDKELLDVIQPSIIPCRTNSVYEVESLDGTQYPLDSVYNIERKFFMLSLPEMYAIYDSSSVRDGMSMEYFQGMTNEQRKIYDETGAAVYVWLRSPVPGYGRNERVVRPSGDYSSNNASDTRGVAEAYTIA